MANKTKKHLLFIEKNGILFIPHCDIFRCNNIIFFIYLASECRSQSLDRNGAIVPFLSQCGNCNDVNGFFRFTQKLPHCDRRFPMSRTKTLHPSAPEPGALKPPNLTRTIPQKQFDKLSRCLHEVVVGGHPAAGCPAPLRWFSMANKTKNNLLFKRKMAILIVPKLYIYARKRTIFFIQIGCNSRSYLLDSNSAYVPILCSFGEPNIVNGFFYFAVKTPKLHRIIAMPKSTHPPPYALKPPDVTYKVVTQQGRLPPSGVPASASLRRTNRPKRIINRTYLP